MRFSDETGQNDTVKGNNGTIMTRFDVFNTNSSIILKIFLFQLAAVGRFSNSTSLATYPNQNGLFINQTQCDHYIMWATPIAPEWLPIETANKLDSVYRFQNFRLSFEIKIENYHDFDLSFDSEENVRQIFNFGHSWKTKQPWIMFNENQGLTVVWRSGVKGLSGGSGNDRIVTSDLELFGKTGYPVNTTLTINLIFVNQVGFFFVNEILVKSSAIDSSRVEYDDVHFIWTSYDVIKNDQPANGTFIKDIRYCRFVDREFTVQVNQSHFCVENGSVDDFCEPDGLAISVFNQIGDLLVLDVFNDFTEFFVSVIELWQFYRECDLNNTEM